MPLYEFQCERAACGHKDTEFAAMKDSVPVGNSIECPKCWRITYRRVVSSVHTDLNEFHTPIETFSVAVDSPEEVRAFKRACPDVEMSDNFADEMFGVPIARNRKQKLAALKHTGFQERN